VIGRARSWLYVPGHRPELLAKAMAGRADAIVFDLEDAVPATAKDTARANARDALAAEQPKPLWLRVNALGSAWCDEDLAGVAGSAAAGLRLPKVEDPAQVVEVAERTGLPLHLVVESALGVEQAYRLATAHRLVAAVSVGEADLMADLRVRDRRALGWARQRVLNANRAARLPSPPQAVWTDVADLRGLEADTRAARDQGFFGRSVVHPSQIETVNQVFTPDPSEVARARDLLGSLVERSDQQESAWLDENGRFVDPAVAASARWVVDLADGIARTTDPERTSS
jgi:citrate lyase subunit beta/citryl-CoA lyase